MGLGETFSRVGVGDSPFVKRVELAIIFLHQAKIEIVELIEGFVFHSDFAALAIALADIHIETQHIGQFFFNRKRIGIMHRHDPIIMNFALAASCTKLRSVERSGLCQRSSGQVFRRQDCRSAPGHDPH